MSRNKKNALLAGFAAILLILWLAGYDLTKLLIAAVVGLVVYAIV